MQIKFKPEKEKNGKCSRPCGGCVRNQPEEFSDSSALQHYLRRSYHKQEKQEPFPTPGR